MTAVKFFSLSANILVGIHFLYVMFVILGELAILTGWLLKWKWIRRLPFRITHLLATVTVAVQSLLDLPCPLTVWENQLRAKAGQTAEWEITFIGRLLRSLIFYDFPDWFFMLLYVGFGGIVILTVILVPPRRKRKLE